MNLQARLNRVERSTGFAPLLPCPMCELTERHVRQWVEIVGDRLFWGAGVPYSYRAVCRFCGLTETRQGNAPDEETAARFAGVLNALAEGRACEVESLDLIEFSETYDRAARECLGEDYPKWQALDAAFSRGVGEIYATYKPRVPVVCLVAGCGCERAGRGRAA